MHCYEKLLNVILSFKLARSGIMIFDKNRWGENVYSTNIGIKLV